MRLQDYITEAVSHGRTKYAYPPEECCSVEYMVNWLEYNGLTGDVLTRETVKWHDPDMSDGKPKYVVRDSNASFSWVNVYNKFGQIITLPLGKMKNTWSDIKFAKTKEPLTLGFDEGVRCIEFIVNNPDKRITMPFLMDLKDTAIKDKARLTEAVSHGNHGGYKDEELPERYDVKGIKSWLDDMGIPRLQQYNDWKVGMSMMHYTFEVYPVGMSYITLVIPDGKDTMYTFEIRFSSIHASIVSVFRSVNGKATLPIEEYQKNDFDTVFRQMYYSIDEYMKRK